MGAISTEEINVDHTDSWSCSTNWTISHGSLEASITFESSDSPNDSEPAHTSPLILHRPSPDSPPCEINLSFMRKHEIRQVYVRSTARVYEMYYAPTQQSENEYLCTVRCCIAERDGEFLQATGIEVKDNIGKLTEGGVIAGTNHCSSKDDWVEVKDLKVPDSPSIWNRDLYEATAQISDADPCISLTIRFLSLQNRDSVCIDDVYIFADPIDSNEMDTPAVPTENQASSFIAMLVPTLLQLSKSGISQKQDKDVFDRQRKENKAGTSDFAGAKKEIDQEKGTSIDRPVELGVNNKLIAEPAHSQPLTHQNLSSENCKFSSMNDDASQARVERALEQLLDRVSRIENICMKFEENMVSPMNSMEIRLERLEHQVEILANKSQYSGVACTRITAPSFTCSESNSTSLHNDGSENRSCGASELEKEDLSYNKLCDPSEDKPVSSEPLHVPPNFVISAPEFSCGGDEEETDIVESAKLSSPETLQKKVLSIDDALAAALSGFLSTSHVLQPDDGTCEVITSGSAGEIVNEKDEFSQSAESASVNAHGCTLEGNDIDKSSRYTQSLAVVAPDFSEDELENPNFTNASSSTAPKLACEKDENNEIASPSTESQDHGGVIKNMHGTSSTVAFEPYAEQQERILNENVLLKETSGVSILKGSLYDATATCPADKDDKVAETNVGESTSEQQMHSLNLETAGELEEHGASKGSSVDIMPNVCEYLRSYPLDFDIPILDVTFAASEDSDSRFSLELLFGDMAEAPSGDNVIPSEGTTFSIMDDEEAPMCSVGDSNPLVDYEIYAADTFPNLDGHSNASTSSNQEVFIGLV